MDGGESPSPPVVARFLTKFVKPGFKIGLLLPPAFSKTLNDTDLVSKRAVLKSCKGSWTVEIKKCDYGCVHFLGKSWEGYVSDHNFKDGDFIVFEHIGHLHFNTNIFNQMGCEKASSFDSEEDVEHQNIYEMDEDDVPTPIKEKGLEDPSRDDVMLGSRIASMEENEAQKLMHKKEEEIRALKGRLALLERKGTGANEDNDHTLELIRELEKRMHDCQKKANEFVEIERRKMEEQMLVQQKENEMLRRRLEEIESQPENAKSDSEPAFDVEGSSSVRRQFDVYSSKKFQITIEQSTLKGYAEIPKEFAVNNDLRTQDKTVELRNGAGGSWRATIHVQFVSEADRDPRKRVRFKGLTKFLTENKLKLGDICTFELVDQASRSMQGPDVVMYVAFKRQGQ